MPNIKEYTSPVEGLQVSNLGVDAVAGAARRIGAEYNQAAEAVKTVGSAFAHNLGTSIKDVGQVVVDYETHREISHGAPTEAQLTNNLTNLWNNTVSDTAKNDPNDPSVAAKFRETVLEPQLDKFREAFSTEGGQKWAEARIDRLRNHFFEKTTADMSTLAGIAVKQNVHELANISSNTAMTDPSSVPHLLDTAESSVGAMVDSSPNLKGPVAAAARVQLIEQMKEGIVKAGAIGAIQKSPDPEKTAQEWGAKYPAYINGAELKQLSAAATRENSYRRTDDNMQRANQDRIRKETSEGRRDQIIQNLYSEDPKAAASVSVRAISRDPNLTVQDKEHLIGVVNRELKPETDAKISNRNYIDVLKGIRTGQISDTDPIFKAREDGRLNKADFNQAMKDFSEYKSPQGEALSKDRAEFFKRYAPAIDPSMSDTASMNFGHFSALGSQKMYEAEKAARRTEEDLRKASKDPHLAYDPSSPEFFGKQLPKYRASLQDSMAYQSEISKADRSAKAPAGPPAAGSVVDGYRYKGGDPSKPASWEKVN